MPPAYRSLWNEIVRILQSERRGRSRLHFSVDEIARRVALLEFSKGVLVTPEKASSEIALGWISQHDLLSEGLVSHRRGVEVVVVRDEDGNAQLQYTSDALTALRMFDPKKVEKAIQDDTRISAEYHDAINDLIRRSELRKRDPDA